MKWGRGTGRGGARGTGGQAWGFYSEICFGNHSRRKRTPLEIVGVSSRGSQQKLSGRVARLRFTSARQPSLSAGVPSRSSQRSGERRLVREAGVEPTTFGFGDRRSIQLSYSRNCAENRSTRTPRQSVFHIRNPRVREADLFDSFANSS